MQKIMISVLLFFLVCMSAEGQNLTVTPTTIIQGGTIRANWSNFGGTVNVSIWKGNKLINYLKKDVKDKQYIDLVMDGVFSEVRTDWNIRVQLSSDTNISKKVYISVVKPTPPFLHLPSNYSIYNKHNTNQIYLNWFSVNNSTNYQIILYKEGNSGNPILNNVATKLNSYTVNNIDKLSNGIYLWQIRVMVNGYWSDYSTAMEFIVDTPPENAPILISPNNFSKFHINTEQNFSCRANENIPSIGSYYLKIVPGDSFNDKPVFTKEITTSTYAISQDIKIDRNTFQHGTYIWGIKIRKSPPPNYNLSLIHI